MAPKNDSDERRVVIPASALRMPARPSFFVGQLLTSEDLRLEQEYLNAKRHLQNLATLGAGVVTGLAVSEEPGGIEVRVSAGYAVDGLGREIIVPADVCVAWPTVDQHAPQHWAVVIEYEEHETDPVPTTNGSMPSRVTEGYSITVLTEPPPGDDTRVVLRPFRGHREPPERD